MTSLCRRWGRFGGRRAMASTTQNCCVLEQGSLLASWFKGKQVCWTVSRKAEREEGESDGSACLFDALRSRENVV